MGVLRFLAVSIPILLSATPCLAADDQKAGHDVDPTASVDTHLPWDTLGVIDARPKGRGFFGYAGEYYSELDGRKMQMSELVAGLGVTDSLSVWYAKQQYLLFGHHAGSRFRLGDNSYGAKWTFKTPTVENETSWALEFEVFQPGSATAVTGSSSETFQATKNITAALDFGTDHDFQYQLAYASVKGAVIGSASVFALGMGKDLNLGPKLKHFQARLQAQIIEQSYTDVDQHISAEFKGVAYGAIGYDMTNSWRLEADGSLFPKGMPLADGRYTALSSFQIYRPGGAAENLRSDTVAPPGR
jgi:hypothetical protein